MVEILAIASIIAPVTSGLVQVFKKAIDVDKRFVPLLALLVGMLLGILAFFTDVGIGERLWAGGISGLASVGLFELGKQTKGDKIE